MSDYQYQSYDLTKQFEGCKLQAYKDIVGVWTIGYGHIKGVKKGDAITQSQADQYLQEDIQHIVNSINKYLKVSVTQNQFDALVDFAFNLGMQALLRSTLWILVQNGKFAEASRQFMRWNHAGGKVVDGLTRRCKARQILFCK